MLYNPSTPCEINRDTPARCGFKPSLRRAEESVRRNAKCFFEDHAAPRVSGAAVGMLIVFHWYIRMELGRMRI